MDDLIGPDKAARILGKSEQWVTTLLREGKLPGQRVGQRWVLRREDVEAYKQGQDKGTTPEIATGSK